MNNNEEIILVEELINILGEIGKHIKKLHPRRATLLLSSKLLSFISYYRCYDLLVPTALFRFLVYLFDRYFDQRIVTLSIEELDKVSMPEEIKNMIKREFQGLDFRYFDFDYVLLFNRLKKDMTTLSEIVKLFGEEFEKKVVECISRAVDRILEELREFQLRILQRALEEIKNKKSVKALEETILECVKEIYVGVSI